MQTTEPMTDEQAVDAMFTPIEPEAEAETDGETQEPEETVADETGDVTEAVEDDASEATDENEGEAEASEDDAEAGDDDDLEDDSPSTVDLHEVQVNGVTHKETLQELKNNYSGRAALQQRHSELKHAAETLQQEREAFLQFAQGIQENGLKRPPEKPDLAMRDTDPFGYLEAKDDYDRALSEYDDEQRQLQQFQERQNQIAQKQTEQFQAQQRDILMEAIPELSDPEKAEKLGKDWAETAEAYGYSSEELSAVNDARALKMLNDAMKYRKLQAEKQTAKKPREEAKPVTRPKGKLRDGGKAARSKKLAQAIKSQRDEDFIDLLFDNP